MSSPHVAPPPAPDDDEPSPKLTRHDRVMAELAQKTELIAADDRVIAQVFARRAEHLVTLQEWSEQDHIAAELHGIPESEARVDRTAPMSPAQSRAAEFARWENVEVARRTIVSETACLTRSAERTVERQLDQAQQLYHHAPATFRALTNGEISYWHATALVDQLRTVPVEGQAAFEEAVLPFAKKMPVGRFRDWARRVRERLHPESIVTRTKNAVAERRTYWEPDLDGMGWLHWYGTAQQTKAACDRIYSMARDLNQRGDPTLADAGNDGDARFASAAGKRGRSDASGQTEVRDAFGRTGDAGQNGDTSQAAETAVQDAEAAKRTLEQLRADITAALLLDGITTTGLGTGVKGTVMVLVTAETLLGRSDEPAILEGYGPISPEAARQIAGNVPGFTRLLTHPETGVVISLGTDRYKVTSGMRKWLRIRDETCRFPGCSRPAVHSDIDHTEDWADGGTTDHDNLAHLCEPHHRLKHLSRWTVKQEPGGILVWTSPGKQTYRTDPANPMGPPRPKPPVVRPKTRKRPADNTYLMPKHQPTRHPSAPVPDDPPF